MKESLFGFIGTILGWLLNESSSWWKTRREDRAKLKEVLFHLLDLYDIIAKTDPYLAADVITQKASLNLPNLLYSDSGVNQLQKGIEAFYEQRFFSVFAENNKRIQNNYAIAIQALSRIDPILAYELSGKEKIINVFSMLNEAKSGEDLLNKTLISNFNSNLVDTTLKLLEEDILKVAQKVSFLYKIRVKKKLYKDRRERETTFEDSIMEFLNSDAAKVMSEFSTKSTK